MHDELEKLAALRRDVEEGQRRLEDLKQLRADFLKVLEEDRERASREAEQARAQFLDATRLLKQIEANSRRIARACHGHDDHKSHSDLIDDVSEFMTEAAGHLAKLDEGHVRPYRRGRFLNDEIVPD